MGAQQSCAPTLFVPDAWYTAAVSQYNPSGRRRIAGMMSRLMTRREQFVLGFLGMSIAAGAAVLFWAQRDSTRPDPIKIDHPEPAAPLMLAPPTPEVQTPRKSEVVVSIQGAVITPGVYTLDEGSRVMDLIKAAGGLFGADTADINLAAPLIDGTTLTVPERIDESELDAAASDKPVNPAAYTISGQGSATSLAPAAGGRSGSGRINVNRATQAELETLPGIGPKLAGQIIQYREGAPFESVDALMDVPGIGPQRLEAIRELITVE